MVDDLRRCASCAEVQGGEGRTWRASGNEERVELRSGYTFAGVDAVDGGWYDVD